MNKYSKGILAIGGLALAGCTANGGFGGIPTQDNPIDLPQGCLNYQSGVVTTTESGSGCELEAIVGPLIQICEVADAANAADGNPDSFATMTTVLTGLDPLLAEGGQQTNVTLTVDLPGTINAADENAYGGFEMQIGGQMNINLLSRFEIKTLINGVETGDSENIAALVDAGSIQVGNGRVVAGVRPTTDFNQIRIEIGADAATIDLDSTLVVYDACTEVAP